MWVYVLTLAIALVGAYAVLAKENLFKKILGLGVFSNAIHVLLIALGYRSVGINPIVVNNTIQTFAQHAADPFPQAMVLTSIVINLSVTAVALIISVHVYRKFGTLDSRKIRGLKG